MEEQEKPPPVSQPSTLPGQKQYDAINKQHASSVSLKDTTNDHHDDHQNRIKFVDWGFKVDRLFEVAYRFYKRNESKAFHPTFDVRNRMNALILQAKYGNFDGEKAPDLGALDLIGKSRRHEWSLLKGMSKTEAMSKFIYTLDEICPFFKAHAEAVKISSNLAQNMTTNSFSYPEYSLSTTSTNSSSMTTSSSSHPDHYTNDTNLSPTGDQQQPQQQPIISDQAKEEVSDQLNAIRTSLNRQTYEQFKSYAEKQYPDNKLKRKDLIISLQEQYYQQYISQMQPKLMQQTKVKQPVIDTNSQKYREKLIKADESHVLNNTTQLSEPDLSTAPSTVASTNQPQQPSHTINKAENILKSDDLPTSNTVKKDSHEVDNKSKNNEYLQSLVQTNGTSYEGILNNGLNSLNITSRQQIPESPSSGHMIEPNGTLYHHGGSQCNTNGASSISQAPIQSCNIYQSVNITAEQHQQVNNSPVMVANSYQSPIQPADQSSSQIANNPSGKDDHQTPARPSNLYQYQYDIKPQNIGCFESFPEPTLIQSPVAPASTPLSFAINMFTSATSSSGQQPRSTMQKLSETAIVAAATPQQTSPQSPPSSTQPLPNETSARAFEEILTTSDLANKKFYEPEILDGAKEVNPLPQLAIPFQPLPSPPLPPAQQTFKYMPPAPAALSPPPLQASTNLTQQDRQVNLGYQDNTQSRATRCDPGVYMEEQPGSRQQNNYASDNQHHSQTAPDGWSYDNSSGKASPIKEQTITYGPLEPASIWTKKGIMEFRETLMEDKQAGIQVVNQGSLMIIQVPTFPDGRYMQFEFCTEDYDIAFGLDFVFDIYVQEPLSMRIYEEVDSDDEDNYGDDVEETGAGAYDGEINHLDYTNDTELVMSAAQRKLDQMNQRKEFLERKRVAKMERAANTVSIVPTYRRDSHQEVFIGRHRYPGQGYYLLKFDNTYSVLRSKTLFFRICYLM